MIKKVTLTQQDRERLVNRTITRANYNQKKKNDVILVRNKAYIGKAASIQAGDGFICNRKLKAVNVILALFLTSLHQCNFDLKKRTAGQNVGV